MSASTPPAERTRNSQLRSETSERSQAKQARIVASTRSRASFVGTRAGESQLPRRTARPRCAARRACQGASTGTLFAMAFIRAMAWPALASAAGLMRGMSPAVTTDLAARGEHVVAVDERLEGGDSHLLGELRAGNRGWARRSSRPCPPALRPVSSGSRHAHRRGRVLRAPRPIVRPGTGAEPR